MRNVGYLNCVALGIAAFVCLPGCGEEEPEVLEPDVIPAPDFPEGQGQLAAGSVRYAPGPYGISKGSIVANYQFSGYGDFTMKSDELQVIQLADFYNPTGGIVCKADADCQKVSPDQVCVKRAGLATMVCREPCSVDADCKAAAFPKVCYTEESDGEKACREVFPSDTPYAGKAGKIKPTALLIDISASWCVPCQNEAKDVLPGKYADYNPRGGEFLMQLAQGPSGDPATKKNLSAWTSAYKVNYVSTIDPGSQLEALFMGGFFPTNIIINTRTMEITRVIAGAPDTAAWS